MGWWLFRRRNVQQELVDKLVKLAAEIDRSGLVPAQDASAMARKPAGVIVSRMTRDNT